MSFRVACRSLARRRGFTAIAILTLAIGVAATTTVFSVVDTVLLKALPFPDSNQLVTSTCVLEWYTTPPPDDDVATRRE